MANVIYTTVTFVIHNTVCSIVDTVFDFLVDIASVIVSLAITFSVDAIATFKSWCKVLRYFS